MAAKILTCQNCKINLEVIGKNSKRQNFHTPIKSLRNSCIDICTAAEEVLGTPLSPARYLLMKKWAII
jgi:hypothetical protein